MTENQNFQAQLEEELITLRELAIISTDPRNIAKYLAVANSEIRKILLEELSNGKHLGKVDARWSTLEKGLIDIRIQITNPARQVALSTTALTATVDVSQRKVENIFLGPEKDAESYSHSRQEPFVFIVSPPALKPSPMAVEEVNRRTNAFVNERQNLAGRYIVQVGSFPVQSDDPSLGHITQRLLPVDDNIATCTGTCFDTFNGRDVTYVCDDPAD